MANAKPSILIPLVSSAQDHQIKNAYYFVRQKASEALLQENLKPHFFLERLKYFISRPDILKQMSDNAQRLARPKAAKVIADYLAEYLKQT